MLQERTLHELLTSENTLSYFRTVDYSPDDQGRTENYLITLYLPASVN
jgi:hypothetical protein